MENEYGVRLDSNGYAPSLLNTGDGCYICERNLTTQRHEIFHGPYREKSKQYGLWINVCHYCHYQIHNGDGRMNKYLKCDGQKAAMERYEWTVQDFRERFGKNYT